MSYVLKDMTMIQGNKYTPLFFILYKIFITKVFTIQTTPYTNFGTFDKNPYISDMWLLLVCDTCIALKSFPHQSCPVFPFC